MKLHQRTRFDLNNPSSNYVYDGSPNISNMKGFSYFEESFCLV